MVDFRNEINQSEIILIIILIISCYVYIFTPLFVAQHLYSYLNDEDRSIWQILRVLFPKIKRP